MPKTPSTKLFDLIQSLTGSEKRYFKIFASKNNFDNVKYLQLFDAIDTQETYDETTLKTSIYNNEILETRKFSELKNYLYELILKSLQGYDEKSSIDFKLKNMLANVRVLAKRSFYFEAKNVLQKAKKIAEKYEQFLVLLEVYKWEKQIAYAESNIKYLDYELEDINKKEALLIHHIESEIKYWNLYFNLLINSKKEGTVRSQDKRELLNQVFQNELLSKNISLSTFQSKVLYHRSYGYYYSSTGNFEQFYQQNNLLINLMENETIRLKEDPSHYISVINNQIFACGMLRKYKEVDENLEKLKLVKAQTLDDQFKIFTQYYLNKLVLCTENGQFQKGEELILRRESEKRKFKKIIFQENFHFLYAYIYFGLKNYEEALFWLNELLDMPKTIVRQDLQSVARILVLIVHYEIGNNILLESLLRSTYRYLRKQDRFFAFESNFLKFIRKSKDIITRKGIKDAYLGLKRDFELLSQEDNEKAIFRYFNFMAWVEAKINENDFEYIIQSHFKENKN